MTGNQISNASGSSPTTAIYPNFQISVHSFELFINNMPEAHQYAFLCHYPELGYMVHEPSQRIKDLVLMDKL